MANPSPPVGPVLGQQDVDIMEFCEVFSVKADSIEKGLPTPVVITVYADRSFTFTIRTPPAAVLLKKVAGIKSGPGKPNKDKADKISRTQLQEIAQIKATDMIGADIEMMTHSIEGTICLMGLTTEDQEVAKLAKYMRVIRGKVDVTEQYDVNKAIALPKEPAAVKFIESVDVTANLGIDARKSDQSVRGATVLPHGTGRSVHVVVFIQGANAEAAKAAGAELVDMEDLVDRIKKGEMNFDVVIASPDAIRIIGQLGQVLDPHGLTPNPKVGTVTSNVAEATKNAKAGQARYRNDKNGTIHITIGRVDFDADKLKENLEVLLVTLRKAKPTQAKGVYIKKVSISTTMGAGIVADQAGLSASVN